MTRREMLTVVREVIREEATIDSYITVLSVIDGKRNLDSDQIRMIFTGDVHGTFYIYTNEEGEYENEKEITREEALEYIKYYNARLKGDSNTEERLGAKLGVLGIESELRFNHGEIKGDPTVFSKNENYADGKVKGKSRPGRVKKSGASCKGSVTELRKKAKKYGGEKGKMYHWCANMKGGQKKSENEESTSKAPKGKSYDSQNSWKPSDVDARSDGAGGRYRRTRPNKPGRSRKTHGEEDAEKKVSKTRAKCQAKAKRKYDVWPSSYASGYVQKCVNRGGNIK